MCSYSLGHYIEQLSVHPFLPRQEGVIMRQKRLNHDKRAFRGVALCGFCLYREGQVIVHLMENR